MRQLASLIALCLITCVSACAQGNQDWAKDRLSKSPRHLEWVDVKAGSRQVKCWVAYPQSKAKATTIVLIHEIFGLSDWVRGLADQLAEQGFVTVAPDLLSGTAPGGGGTNAYKDEDAAREAISKLPADQITSDLNAVVNYAAKLPASNGKVVVAGFCWGGGQAFRFATNNSKIRASFVFYGPPPQQKDLANVKAPVYGFYAENDARINATLDQTILAMKKLGKPFQPVVYKGGGHGFMRSGEAPDADKANKSARAIAWKRWIDLLRKI